MPDKGTYLPRNKPGIYPLDRVASFRDPTQVALDAKLLRCLPKKDTAAPWRNLFEQAGQVALGDFSPRAPTDPYVP